ncbi:ATP-binding protein [Paracoccus denitrificans]|uniref:ATP-binding protein n=1 Tax=Paracoccus denitrificans TaxID=266 RepID=UPI000CEBFF77|nr:ATP-binding protein [Paracoccus denitrificans]
MSEILHIDATPQKRLFLSIIADYDVNTAICELLDNAIDHWIDGGKEGTLRIDARINIDRQTIVISDNAGGVKREDLQLLVAPGASRERIQEGLIGNFGVGGKRAGIALGELVEIKTRHKKGKTFELELSDKWLSQSDWNVDVYECESIGVGTTTVRISKMRQGFDEKAVASLRKHIAETYGNFISDNCKIEFNGELVEPVRFDQWAFPPSYPPSQHLGEIGPFGVDESKVKVIITGGLTYDRDPSDRNYGVYFYCNDRLVLAHEKSHHVGFMQKIAGVPHPDASLCRVIVELRGMPTQMPWNSSKSGVNWSHPVYLEIREEIFALATRYSTISRRLKGDREGEVYAYKRGDLEPKTLNPGSTGKEIVSLPVPRGRQKNYPDRIIEQNEDLFKKKPWVRGLIEAVGIAELIFRRKVSTKNRVALIVIDSTLEISLKEYLVHQKAKYYSDSQIADLFKSRDKVLKEIESLTKISKRDLDLARHYANLRNKLIHERATVNIPDDDIVTYKAVTDRIIHRLFGASLE